MMTPGKPRIRPHGYHSPPGFEDLLCELRRAAYAVRNTVRGTLDETQVRRVLEVVADALGMGERATLEAWTWSTGSRN